MNIDQQLEAQFGLTTPNLRVGLSQDELFNAAIENDRGRVSIDGGTDEQKAYPTALGVDGPLVYYTDPECTGRPVNDTFAVARPEVVDTVWWKPGFAQFDPAAFDELLPRVIEHLNQREATLYVTDVFCGWDPEYSEPYRFVGEYATHATSATLCFQRTCAMTPTVPELVGPSSTPPRSLQTQRETALGRTAASSWTL